MAVDKKNWYGSKKLGHVAEGRDRQLRAETGS